MLFTVVGLKFAPSGELMYLLFEVLFLTSCADVDTCEDTPMLTSLT